ncbi:DEAD/DEAH box helicase family protein [Desulfovibrio sp. ZJ200]|uniref:type III restriction-modification system endonuclease n=1 Tax=Desulfovibrio sp. ZJ200 TaxID=2709792 RepID=UPI0013EC0D9A|nr:DEAD/DEAH box helicase family protein [Desulfovibrio sp. ZJ200]
MKLQFRHQKFQADAARAVCDVFTGQPRLTPSYMMDKGITQRSSLTEEEDFTGFGNARIVPQVSDGMILENIQKIQRSQQIAPSPELAGRYNLTVEMETGVGKTYTYIKTMYELNQRYGWSKFIIVVPSVAIREGVYKSFQITEEHFAEEYGKKIRYFIYNSAQLTEIDRFASDSAINVMIINSQAFNARGRDARRIYMKLDEFRSRKPIDILAKTNPILIIDEPQSVEGRATKDRLREFNPLFTLRYSATHRADSIYNMVYRLDAMEAYNKRLVKKIAVKGIATSGTTGTEGYVYLESINLSRGNPTATIEFEVKSASGIRPKRLIVNEGCNLFPHSGELTEYKDGYVVRRIDGRDSSLEFVNGKKLFAGDVIGKVKEEYLRRIQIRETIISHFERERILFYKGIKVLSLFFIDEVAKYKQYDDSGMAHNGEYADMFEEEYNAVLKNMQINFGEEEYSKFLNACQAETAHAGYFSIDKKSKRLVDSKLGDRKERTSDDSDAYDLIMKNKERLLDRAEPVRFIFSHSALREGWDNPNVFQICTLKQSGSDVRKRQEVGRGLRLSVNQNGERMDANLLGEDVHNINILTVIANESYDSFAKGLQSEIAEAVADRPRKVTADLFKGKVIKDASGAEQVVDDDLAQSIYEGLITNGYVKKGVLTEKYYADKKNGTLELAEEAADCKDAVIAILDSVYEPVKVDNARSSNVEATLDRKKLESREFQALWAKINAKSAYMVTFDEKELVAKAIAALNRELRVSQLFIRVEGGALHDIASRENLLSGSAMRRKESKTYTVDAAAGVFVKYDLIGKVVAETGLTRKAVADILSGMGKSVFDQFKNNPEEFIIRASGIINEQKATVIIQHITYDKLDSSYATTIFTEPTLKGQLGVNAMPANKHLYDYIVYDSENEQKFASNMDSASEVAVYVKLPRGFYINTPVGKYNPDWAIAFHEGNVKHIYFVAETKGSMSSMQLRKIEEAKIHCAREHFKAISSDSVIYDVVDSYETLMNLVMR